MKKEVKDWTDEDALIHTEGMLHLFEHELHLLIEGEKAKSLWACNRGARSAAYRLDELIKNYQRIVNVLVNKKKALREGRV